MVTSAKKPLASSDDRSSAGHFMKDVNCQRREGNQQNLKPIEKWKTEKPRLDEVVKNGKDREKAG
jgi:hypothetical protein